MYIYTPRSGSRLFVVNCHEAWDLIELENASYKLDAPGAVHIKLWTAEPGRHWREELKALLSKLAVIFPIIGWDDQGHVNWVCSPADAISSLEMAASICPYGCGGRYWEDPLAHLLSQEGVFLLPAPEDDWDHPFFYVRGSRVILDSH